MDTQPSGCKSTLTTDDQAARWDDFHARVDSDPEVLANREAARKAWEAIQAALAAGKSWAGARGVELAMAVLLRERDLAFVLLEPPHQVMDVLRHPAHPLMPARPALPDAEPGGREFAHEERGQVFDRPGQRRQLCQHMRHGIAGSLGRAYGRGIGSRGHRQALQIRRQFRCLDWL